jgi:hypothetical protein
VQRFVDFDDYTYAADLAMAMKGFMYELSTNVSDYFIFFSLS